jgi:hypothetical protein
LWLAPIDTAASLLIEPVDLLSVNPKARFANGIKIWDPWFTMIFDLAGLAFVVASGAMEACTLP